jgi:hypothetical protein
MIAKVELSIPKYDNSVEQAEATLVVTLRMVAFVHAGVAHTVVR